MVRGRRLINLIVPSEIGEYNDIFGAKTATRDATERLSAVKLFLTFLKKKKHININLAQHLDYANPEYRPESF
ncbi:MAG: hypothetical protein CM1200mP39_27730 [Dehalococcoidia bacterium]|nr:MAG: hypothetical protein CM1200mP39_27730 [Dehalococcoidia bacterium]